MKYRTEGIRRRLLLVWVMALGGLVGAPTFAENNHPTDAELSKSEVARKGASVMTTSATTGNLLGTFPAAGSVPVGLEHDGAGNLLLTDIGADTVSRITTGGTVLETSAFTQSANPIGVTTDGTYLYVTDTTDDDVDVYAMDGTYVRSFPTSLTTFPEGITYHPDTDHLFVVDGSGGNAAYEYTMDGTLVATYPLAAYVFSPDGIAWDPIRQCFWVYDSGSDSVTQYDASFNWLDAFPGSRYHGYASGEGLAVMGNRLYLVATGSGTILEFDLSGAIGFSDFCIQDPDSDVAIWFNVDTGDFVYTNGTDWTTGTGVVRVWGCSVVLRYRGENQVLVASVQMCQGMTGRLIVRHIPFDSGVVLVRRGTVNDDGCDGMGTGGGWPPAQPATR